MGNDQAAHNTFGDLVHTVQLSGEAGLAGEVDHSVNAFLLVVDGVGQTALAPLVDGTPSRLEELPVICALPEMLIFPLPRI